MVEERLAAARAAVLLQLDEPLDEGVGQRLAQRIAHRDVDLAHLGRQRVEQRQQQVLVGQHHGGLLAQRPVVAAQAAQNLADVLALHGIRDARDGEELLPAAEVVVRHPARRREGHDVAPDEHAGLLLPVVAVVVVEIPVEPGPGGRRQVLEELLLARREGVEARHDEAPRAVEGEAAAAQPLDGRALHHAPVGDSQLPPAARGSGGRAAAASSRGPGSGASPAKGRPPVRRSTRRSGRAAAARA